MRDAQTIISCSVFFKHQSMKFHPQVRRNITFTRCDTLSRTRDRVIRGCVYAVEQEQKLWELGKAHLQLLSPQCSDFAREAQTHQVHRGNTAPSRCTTPQKHPPPSNIAHL